MVNSGKQLISCETKISAYTGATPMPLSKSPKGIGFWYHKPTVAMQIRICHGGIAAADGVNRRNRNIESLWFNQTRWL
jgi:hypothetical protein